MLQAALMTTVALAFAIPAASRGQWPMPGHDAQLRARAELPCDMPQAPAEAWSYDVGRLPTRWAMCADVDGDGAEEVLWGPAPLVCTDLSGKERWRAAVGGVVAIADLDGDGAVEIVVDGPHIVDGRTGKLLWSRTGPGYAGRHRIHVGKLIPQLPGLQIACVSERYEYNQAQVWSFEDSCAQGKLVWEREFNKGGVYAHCTSAAGRYDATRMCVAAAVEGGLVALDARDGSDLFRFYWQPRQGEGGVRNYGSLAIRDLDGDGTSEFVILNDLIAVQLGAFAPARGPVGEVGTQTNPWPGPDAAYGALVTEAEGPMLWRRYFGYWYPQAEYSLHVPPDALADVDGDGRQEIVVSVHRKHWDLKVYDALTGAEKLSVPNLYVHALEDLDGDGVPEIIAAREPTRTPREFTTLTIGSVRDGSWAERFRRAGCRMEYTPDPLQGLGFSGRNTDHRAPVVADGPGGRSLVVALDDDRDSRPNRIAFLRAQPGERFALASTPLPADVDGAGLATTSDGRVVTTSANGRMVLLAADESRSALSDCSRPGLSGAVVADIDGDGRNEVLVARANRRIAALRAPSEPGGEPVELWQADGWGFPALQAYGPVPLAADVDGDGRSEVLVACSTEAGGVGVKLLNGEGLTIWQTAIPGAVETPLYTAIGPATVGDFTGDGLPDVYVSARMAPTGNDASHSFALDGRTGAILWHNDASAPVVWHHTMGPTRMATTTDVNGDGRDDVLFVTLDLCATLNGTDGSFIGEPVIANSIWDQQGKSTQWTAYGSQLPADLDGDGTLEILLAASWGQWGAWTMDRKLLWTFDPGPDAHANTHPGIADVDGDGRLEIGTVHVPGVFRCYDAQTGALRWEVGNIHMATDVVVADIDGDGRPEFLTGLNAIKADSPTSGRLLWQVPVPYGLRTPAVADVDGDGRSEIVIGCGDGKVRVYK